MRFDITMVGHISRDTLVYMDEETTGTGGAVFYSSIAGSRSGKKINVVTLAAPADESELDVMRKNGVMVTRLASAKTTAIRINYFTPDRERREVLLEAQADPFSIREFPEIESRIYHLAGLFRGEIPDEFIPFFAERGDVAVDAQGVLRCSEGGKLLFRNWDAAETLMPLITYFKTDAAEAEIMTGESDREKAALKLAALGAREVMVTHNDEVLVLAGGEFVRAPYTASNLSGRTGRGDTTFAAYLAKRLDADPREAVYYAAALCSLKMESPGPFRNSINDVYKRMYETGFSRP